MDGERPAGSIMVSGAFGVGRRVGPVCLVVWRLFNGISGELFSVRLTRALRPGWQRTGGFAARHRSYLSSRFRSSRTQS